MVTRPCPYPTKKLFLTRADAAEGCKAIQARVEASGGVFTKLHPYRCPAEGRDHWHLSSSRQGRAACPQCAAVSLPAWFDNRSRQWVVYAHGACPTQAVTR